MDAIKALSDLEDQRTEATQRWDKAQRDYRSVCSWFGKLRNSSPPENQMSNLERLIYEMAKTRISEAAKKRKAEEELYWDKIRSLSEKRHEILVASVEVMNVNL